MREELIRISKEEKELLDKARQEIFGSDSVPYGEVVERLANKFLEVEA